MVKRTKSAKKAAVKPKKDVIYECEECRCELVEGQLCDCPYSRATRYEELLGRARPLLEKFMGPTGGFCANCSQLSAKAAIKEYKEQSKLLVETSKILQDLAHEFGDPE